MKGRCVKVVFTVSTIPFILTHTLGSTESFAIFCKFLPYVLEYLQNILNRLDNMSDTTYYANKQTMNGGMAMSSYKDYRKRALQNPEVKAEYDALQPEQELRRQI